MRPEFVLQTQAAELKHWWFVYRRQLLSDELLKHFKPASGLRVLDLGCGTGGNLDAFKFLGELSGLELNPQAAELARAKGHRVLTGSVGDLAKLFAGESFDVIFMLNVLYHRAAPSEALVLADVLKLLKPGALLLWTEPALPFLFRHHDRVDEGKKRYTYAELRAVVEASGLKLKRLSAFNGCLLPLVALGALWDRVFPSTSSASAELAVPPLGLNQLLLACFQLERCLLRCINFRWGVTYMVVAEKTT